MSISRAYYLYSMDIHDEIFDCGWSITRVPGGWIYRTNREGSEVFVPFHNEFQESQEDE